MTYREEVEQAEKWAQEAEDTVLEAFNTVLKVNKDLAEAVKKLHESPSLKMMSHTAAREYSARIRALSVRIGNLIIFTSVSQHVLEQVVKLKGL